jgi:hypothetical protein
MRHINQEQFEQHIKNFKDSLGIELYGTHAVLGDIAVPTVRTNLYFRKNADPQGDGTDQGENQYWLQASVPGNEGNLHTLAATNFSRDKHYLLKVYVPEDDMHDPTYSHDDSSFQTDNLSEFSQGFHEHLKKGEAFRPNTRLSSFYYDDWHRRNQLRAVEVSDWDEHGAPGVVRVYDHMTGKYV